MNMIYPGLVRNDEAFFMKQFLRFSDKNAKLYEHVGLKVFSLPAGHSCPFAKACKSSANKETGKITDGPHTEFRCFGATVEARYVNVRKKVWANYDLLKEAGLKNEEALTELIESSLAKEHVRIIRVFGTGGDYMTRELMNAWSNVARNNLHVLFYGYTKAIKFMIDTRNTRPDNHRLVASFGGVHDKLIVKHNLVSAKVVFSEEEAEAKGLEIDHNDMHAMNASYDFALLLHGTQSAGSDASKALQALRKKGITGYSKKK